MDPQLSKAVLTIFKRLYDAGLIYRAERIINWCPRCLTALSDIEVDHQDDAGEEARHLQDARGRGRPRGIRIRTSAGRGSGTAAARPG